MRAALRPDPSVHIGIIGAGASGLTAAHFLREAGYRRITLFEKRGRVGGKCETLVIGEKSYELGAVLGSPSYHTIDRLAQHTGLATEAGARCHYYTPRGRRTGLFARRRLPRLAWQLFGKYFWLTTGKYRRIYEPGLDGIAPELHENFNSFATRHGLPLVPQVFQPVATGFGYGYAEKVPAAYMLKYLDWPTIFACARGKGLYIWPEGSQRLWHRLAREHVVYCDVTITSVRRANDGVMLETNLGRFELDLLILACPLDRTLPFLDATPAERRLFGRIRYFDYWVLLCEIEGLPRDTGFIPAHFGADKQGHVMLWYCRQPDTPLYTLYVLNDFRTSADVVESSCAADVRRLGGSLRRLLDVRRWRYFPHVQTADMAGGFYETLEALQGQNRTYYTGEIMSFSTLECCARYSRALVERFFSPAGAEEVGTVQDHHTPAKTTVRKEPWPTA